MFNLKKQLALAVIIAMVIVTNSDAQLGRLSPSAESFNPVAWNEMLRKNADGTFTSQFHGKWVNYNDGQTWKKIDLSLRINGTEYVMDKAPFEARIPKFADGMLTFTNNNRFSSDGKLAINTASVSKQKWWVGSNHVAGVVEGNSVVYHGALPVGDIIYELHEQELRSIVRINQQSGSGDIELPFLESYSDNMAPQLKNGVTIGAKERDAGRGYSVEKTKDRAIVTRPAYVWDSGSPQKRQEIPVLCSYKESISSCKKVLPKEFLENAVYPVFTDTVTTFFSGAGDGQITSISNTSWSSARNSGGNYSFSADYTASTLDMRNDYFPVAPYYYCYRLYFPFDTSSLTSTATITASVFKVKSTGAESLITNATHLVQSSQASLTTLSTSDFTPSSFTSSANIAAGSWSIGGSNAFTMDATGRGWISKTGVTKLALIGAPDQGNSAPGGYNGGNDPKMYSSEQTGTSDDPQLEVTYTVPVTSKPIIMMISSITMKLLAVRPEKVFA